MYDGYQGTVYDQNQPAQCIKINQQKKGNCDGTTKPKGNNYRFGGATYTQVSTDSGITWTPTTKSWTYTGSKSPGECEYTCNYGAEWSEEYSRCFRSKTKPCDGSYPDSTTIEKGQSWYTQLEIDGERSPNHKPWIYTSNSTLGICQYRCAAGYLWNGNTCVLPQNDGKECTGEVPANATLIVGDDQGLTSNTQRKLVSSNTSAKCEYICNSGFHYGSCGDASAGASLGGSSSDVPCCQKNQCIGQDPANATLIPRDDQGLTRDTLKTLVPSNTSAKCEYICNSGFVLLENRACVIPQCIGDVPANATLITGDDQGLTTNTQITLVSSDSSAKCQYMCDASKGYTLQNGACAKLMMCNPNYHNKTLSNLVQTGNHLCITGASLVEGSFKQNGQGNDIQYDWTCIRNTNDKLTSRCVADYHCDENAYCGMCNYQGKRVPEDSLPDGVNCAIRGPCKCLGNDSPTGPIPQGYCKAINSYYESLCSPLTSTEDDIVAAEKACITTYGFIPGDNGYTMCLDYYSEVKASSDDPTAYPLGCYIRDMNTMIGAQHPLIQIPSLCIWIDGIRPSN